MSGDSSGGIGITQRELLVEMRDDICGLRSLVDAVARDQALSFERLASMQRVGVQPISRDLVERLRCVEEDPWPL